MIIYFIAPTGHTFVHNPQPVQRAGSITTLPSFTVMAGHPNSLIHFLQLIHLSESILHVFSGLNKAIQGDLKMTALTPG